jgi:hypothetical protein
MHYWDGLQISRGKHFRSGVYPFQHELLGLWCSTIDPPIRSKVNLIKGYPLKGYIPDVYITGTPKLSVYAKYNKIDGCEANDLIAYNYPKDEKRLDGNIPLDHEIEAAWYQPVRVANYCKQKYHGSFAIPKEIDIVPLQRKQDAFQGLYPPLRELALFSWSMKPPNDPELDSDGEDDVDHEVEDYFKRHGVFKTIDMVLKRGSNQPIFEPALKEESPEVVVYDDEDESEAKGDGLDRKFIPNLGHYSSLEEGDPDIEDIDYSCFEMFHNDEIPLGETPEIYQRFLINLRTLGGQNPLEIIKRLYPKLSGFLEQWNANQPTREIVNTDDNENPSWWADDSD